MIKAASSLFVATALALGLHVASAQAQLARTFVSSEIGNDANDCGRLTPCRTFQRAHDTTLTLGEITVLDPGGYGAVNITKGISIINDGVGEAGVLVSGGLVGITINAGASDAVSLRGLTVKGIGFGGGTGIRFNSGKSLTVENCAIRNLTGADPIGVGINFRPNAAASLAISNTIVTDNSQSGVRVDPVGSGLTVKAVVNRSEFHNNGNAGFTAQNDFATGTTEATVSDSVASNNGSNGFSAQANGGGGIARLMVVRSLSVNNVTGLDTNGAAGTIRLSQSTIRGNGTGWSAGVAGTITSYGDNNIDDNPLGNGAPPLVAKK